MSRQPQLFVPAITPFKADLSVDVEKFIHNCKMLLADGAHGLAPFGTTSEANSLSVEERMSLLDQLIDSGVPASCLIPGTGCSALPDTIHLSAHATKRGCKGVLALPPFYYKGVPEDGVFAAFSKTIEAVGSADFKVYLYHIPQMTGVPITLALTERLLAAYPDTIAGLKDSSGVWENTLDFIKAFPQIESYSASEALIPQNVAAGGAGCISASANVNAAGIVALMTALGTPEEEKAAEKATEIRKIFESIPLIPGIKATVARRYADDGYAIVRPPFSALPEKFNQQVERAAHLCFRAAGAVEAAHA
jgi:4-hydroxy-tetrahydrodipicolinate synthase